MGRSGKGGVGAAGPPGVFTGKVIGTAVATRKNEKLVGKKLLVVQPLSSTGAPAGKPLLAVDLAGAGAGEVVLLCRSGDAARAAGGAPVDAAVIGIVDAMHRQTVPGPDLRALGLGAPGGGQGG